MSDALKRQQLLDVLRVLAKLNDTEIAHSDADDALLRYINDAEIESAYNEITKWYA